MTRFWKTDHGLSVFLGILLITVFVMPMFRLRDTSWALVPDLMISLSLIAGVWAVSERRGVFLIAVAVTATALFIRWILVLAPGGPLGALQAASQGVTLGMFSLMIIAQVLRRGTVNKHRIMGAVAGYLLLGLTWASAYQVVAALYPGAFSSLPQGPNSQLHWVYFSLMTLTTTGYGDVTPLHESARALACLESIVGQLYPAILIAHLVSLQVQARIERESQQQK